MQLIINKKLNVNTGIFFILIIFYLFQNKFSLKYIQFLYFLCREFIKIYSYLAGNIIFAIYLKMY
ncbi:hypothetical protein DKB58_06960 [Capnocytophaga canimorsus]|nr:hypothetical protein DKB58_06960 [Capnocytophaga canimorsus]AYW37303.1 hypothetical protein D8L92_08375 [Capnocytophaga canimorsus]